MGFWDDFFDGIKRKFSQSVKGKETIENVSELDTKTESEVEKNVPHCSTKTEREKSTAENSIFYREESVRAIRPLYMGQMSDIERDWELEFSAWRKENLYGADVKENVPELDTKTVVPNNWLKLHGMPMRRRRH